MKNSEKEEKYVYPPKFYEILEMLKRKKDFYWFYFIKNVSH